MKKLITIYLVLATLIITGSSAFAISMPHPVYVSVDNMDGLTPVASDVVFDAWLLVRPGEVGDKDVFDWDYGTIIPGTITINCGNGFSTWAAGDVLHIEASQISTGYTGIGEYTLTNDNFQMFSGNDGMTLTPEPATLCLLGFGALSLIRKKRHA